MTQRGRNTSQVRHICSFNYNFRLQFVNIELRVKIPRQMNNLHIFRLVLRFSFLLKNDIFN